MWSTLLRVKESTGCCWTIPHSVIVIIRKQIFNGFSRNAVFIGNNFYSYFCRENGCFYYFPSGTAVKSRRERMFLTRLIVFALSSDPFFNFFLSRDTHNSFALIAMKHDVGPRKVNTDPLDRMYSFIPEEPEPIGYCLLWMGWYTNKTWWYIVHDHPLGG